MPKGKERTCLKCGKGYSMVLSSCPHCSEFGSKHTEGKLPLQLIPIEALFGVAEVLEYGREKYAARNWERGVSYSELYRASISHLFKWFMGQENDEESELHHLKHAACDVLMLLTLVLRHKKSRKLKEKFDDRKR